MRRDWASDVTISTPVPHEGTAFATFSGWAFGSGGLHHDVSEADVEDMSTPPIAPHKD